MSAPAIHVGKIPGAKRRALYEVRGNTIRVLVWFQSDAHERQTLEWIEALAAKRECRDVWTAALDAATEVG